MGRGKVLNEKEKGHILAYKDSGMSHREIGRRMGRSCNVVNQFIKNGDEYGVNKSPGRPPKLTPRNKRAIIAKASNSTIGSRRLRNEFAPNVSHVTVWNALKESSNLVYKKMKSVPTLKKEHCKTRLTFADLHQTWTHQWHSVCAYFLVRSLFILFILKFLDCLVWWKEIQLRWTRWFGELLAQSTYRTALLFKA